MDLNLLLSVGVLVFLFFSVGAMSLMGRATQSVAGAFLGLAVVCFASAVFIYFNLHDEKALLVTAFFGAGGLGSIWATFELSVHRAHAGYEQTYRSREGEITTTRISHAVQGRGAHESSSRFEPHLTGGSAPRQLGSGLDRTFLPPDMFERDEAPRGKNRGRK